MNRWAVFLFHKRRWIVLAWIGIVIALAAIAFGAGGNYRDNFSIPGAESQKAIDLLEERFPAQAGESAAVVFAVKEGVMSDPLIRQQVEELLQKLTAIPSVTEVESPYEEKSDAISDDGAIAYANVLFAQQAPDVPDEDAARLFDLAGAYRTQNLQIELGGPIARNYEQQEPGSSEIIGIAAAAIILLISFGSVVAMGLPILTALAGLGSAILIILIGRNVIDLSTFTPSFAAMLGLGVGIDYSLLVVTRFREALAAGAAVPQAMAIAINTAGRSVAFAGIVVIIALLGLFTIGLPFVANIAIASSVVVALTVLVALSLLPALLTIIGRNIDRWRVPMPGTGKDSQSHEQGFWFRYSRFVQRHSVPFLLVSLALLILLAVPVFSMDLGSSDDGNGSTSLTTRRSYDLLSQGFGPGFNGRLIVVTDLSRGGDEATVEAIRERIAQTPNIAQVSTAQFNDDGDAAVVQVFPETSPQDNATEELVHTLRDDIIPPALAGAGAAAFVTGQTAAFVDVTDLITGRLPFFLTAVIGLSFILLMAIFRSIAIPIKAAIVNMLSLGASLGILVAVFQWGWAAGAIGVGKEGPIESFLPMMMFAVLFGLSMDYEVFLISRIREEYLRTRDNHNSIAFGLAATARVISAAAAIMTAVFLSFTLNDDRIVKEFGLGLGAAIVIDATIVRLMLVPAAMQILGSLNWRFPVWLDRIIPRIGIEAHAQAMEGVGARAGASPDAE